MIKRWRALLQHTPSIGEMSWITSVTSSLDKTYPSWIIFFNMNCSVIGQLSREKKSVLGELAFSGFKKSLAVNSQKYFMWCCRTWQRTKHIFWHIVQGRPQSNHVRLNRSVAPLTFKRIPAAAEVLLSIIVFRNIFFLHCGHEVCSPRFGSLRLLFSMTTFL